MSVRLGRWVLLSKDEHADLVAKANEPHTVIVQGGMPGVNGIGGRGGSMQLKQVKGGIIMSCEGGASGDGNPGEVANVFIPYKEI